MDLDPRAMSGFCENHWEIHVFVKCVLSFPNQDSSGAAVTVNVSVIWFTKTNLMSETHGSNGVMFQNPTNLKVGIFKFGRY